MGAALLEVRHLDGGVHELDVGELGHVGARGSAELLGDLVHLPLHLRVRLGRRVHQLAARRLLLVRVVTYLGGRFQGNVKKTTFKSRGMNSLYACKLTSL